MTDSAENSCFSWPDGIRGALSFSFDDGRRSQITNGLSLFDELGLKATFYLTPRALLDAPETWKHAHEAGHEIANHTTTHPCSGNFTFVKKGRALEDMTLERIEKDILNCNAVIEEHIGITPSTFAYPCGQKFVGRGVEMQSYVPVVAKHFMLGRGFRDEWHNDPVEGDMSQAFGMECDRASFEEVRPWIDRALECGGWVILAGHDIADEGQQATHLDTIRAIAEYAKDPERGLWVETVETVGQYVKDRALQVDK